MEGDFNWIWVKVDTESKDFLCSKAVEPTPDWVPEPSINVEPLVEMEPPPAGAGIHPVVQKMPAAEIISFCCGDNVAHAQHFAKEKRWESFSLIPLMPITLAWDISATVVMSSYFDFVMLPNFLLAKAGKKLMGVED